ncbi:MAG: adenosyl-hopene transferase HpnH [Rhodospirillaceae bacterium]|nr:adenosyl-hopene transferase HpnH [Rhodospirillaceae bacterium]
MGIPIIQQLRVGSYIVKQKLKGVRRYPLVLMLEPLFRCNLACTGCGKIDYPDTILNRRLSVDECISAVEECGAPIVSIPGGEPLLHKELPEIIRAIVARKKFVYLCTNALLLEKRMDDYQPSPYLTLSIHLDGDEEHHDKAVNQHGVYARAVAAIREARRRGFRVTVNCTLFGDVDTEKIADFFSFACDDLDVEGVTVAPGYAYERAPVQEHFLNREKTKQLFRNLFRLGRGRKWRFNQSSLYLDFLAGNQKYECTPWGNPTRNVFGWQRPCYLIGEGYTSSFQDLMDETDWDSYGTGNYEKCADCMVHCGYEPTAVADTVAHPLKALKVALMGVDTERPMVADIMLDNQRPAEFVFEELTKELAQPKTGSGDRSDAA